MATVKSIQYVTTLKKREKTETETEKRGFRRNGKLMNIYISNTLINAMNLLFVIKTEVRERKSTD